jgi:hypothetical protein
MEGGRDAAVHQRPENEAKADKKHRQPGDDLA